MRRIAEPEFIYLLSFAPENLKYDGSFHGVKVVVKGSSLNAQAPPGYYSPLHPHDPQERAKQDLSEALFAHDEVQEFPVTVKTGIAMSTPTNGRLSTLVHIDMKPLPFKKVADRSSDTLTLVYGLFDKDGKLLKTVKQNVEMHLKANNFDARMQAGLDVKNVFDIHPGHFTLRVAVRDSEGAMVSARNVAVIAP